MFGRLLGSKEPCLAPRMRYAHLVKFVPRAAMRVAPDRVFVHRGRLHDDVGPSRLGEQVLHHEFRHWAAADVPVANEQDLHRRRLYQIAADFAPPSVRATLDKTYHLKEIFAAKTTTTAASIKAETSFKVAVAFTEPTSFARKKSAATITGR